MVAFWRSYSDCFWPSAKSSWVSWMLSCWSRWSSCRRTSCMAAALSLRAPSLALSSVAALRSSSSILRSRASTSFWASIVFCCWSASCASSARLAPVPRRAELGQELLLLLLELLDARGEACHLTLQIVADLGERIDVAPQLDELAQLHRELVLVGPHGLARLGQVPSAEFTDLCLGRALIDAHLVQRALQIDARARGLAQLVLERRAVAPRSA